MCSLPTDLIGSFPMWASPTSFRSSLSRAMSMQADPNEVDAKGETPLFKAHFAFISCS